MSKVESGQNISVHYTGTLDDGTKFDSSHDRGETLTFSVGSGQMIAGFDAAVVGMEVGEKKQISLDPSQAYGNPVDAAVQTFPISSFPEDLELKVGGTLVGHHENGQQMLGKIVSLTEESAVLDFNHPLAGQNLNFEIELVSIN